MALQFSVAVRNAMLDAIESTIGTGAVMRIFSGAAPASCATADSGTILAELTLPTDWLAAAAAGVKSLSGTWEDSAANADGTAGHFRIYDSGITTCHMQGTVAASGADLNVSNTSFATGQPFSVTQFDITAGNA